MRRREALAGVASVGVLATGGVLATRGLPSLDSSGGDDDATAEDTTDEPVTLQTLEAPGSQAGTVTIPAADDSEGVVLADEDGTEGEPAPVTLLEFFATTCGTCISMMPRIDEAAAAVETATVVSVTSLDFGPETEAEELVEWWDDHDGNWTVAIDDSLDLTRRFQVAGYPTTVVLDANGKEQWRERGRKSVDELVDAMERVE